MDTERIEGLLLAILLELMREESQTAKIRQLTIAGLSNLEIANALETTPAVVAQTIYTARRGQRVKKKVRRS